MQVIGNRSSAIHINSEEDSTFLTHKNKYPSKVAP